MDIFVAVDNECTFWSRNFSVYITISVESEQGASRKESEEVEVWIGEKRNESQ